MTPALASGWTPGDTWDDYDIIGSSPMTLRKVAGMAITAALATGNPAISTLYVMPIMSPRRGGVLDLMEVCMTVDGTAADVRFGVYETTSYTNVYPGAKIYDSGKIDGLNGSGTPVSVSCAPDLSLRPSTWYWLAYICDTATISVRTVPLGSTRPLGIIGGVATATAGTVGWASGSHADITATDLADPYPASATAITTTPIPAIGYHFSA